ncbi:MAG: ribosome small subunit-dependent GTPase A [Candidatus Nitrospinota bacterium M3_3B_026]
MTAHHGARVRIDTAAGMIEWKPPRREVWVVGDYVVFEKGRPKTIAPRKNELARSGFGGTRQVLAANLDQMVIVTSCDANYRPGLVDRFAVIAGHEGMAAIIVLNKVDLPGAEGYVEQARAYEKLGLRLLLASALTGEGLEELKEALKEKTSAMVGHSGVGKTSLLNALIPGLDRPVGDVDEETARGRHITTVSLLAPLPEGGFIIDSPGIRQLVPSEITPEDVARHFPGLQEYIGGCRFRDCLHIAEPGCAVREAVENGAIGEKPYASYRRLLESLKENTSPRRRK